jgi:hypothetical protein
MMTVINFYDLHDNPKTLYGWNVPYRQQIGRSGLEVWMLNGKVHRDGGPAVDDYGCVEWYFQGEMVAQSESRNLRLVAWYYNPQCLSILKNALEYRHYDSIYLVHGAHISDKQLADLVAATGAKLQ